MERTSEADRGGNSAAVRAAWPEAADRKRVWPLHVFLLAVTPVLTLYASNVAETSFTDVLPAIAATLLSALSVYLAAAAVVRCFGARAALMASVVVVGCLFYSELFVSLNRLLGGGYSMTATLPPALTILAVLIIFLARTRISLAVPNLVLNAIAVVLFIMPTSRVALYEWRNAGSGWVAQAETSGGAQRALASETTSGPNERPNIYYFIFDRYAAQDTLAEHYGYDNGDLIGFLKGSGFYVASESRSNYFKTAHSVASTFHMDYINFLSETVRDSGDWRPIHSMLEEHRVARFLKAQGYRFIQLGSWWKGTQHNPFADENYSFGLSEFNMIYVRKTILRPILNAVSTEDIHRQRLAWDNGQCRRVRRKIEKIKALAERPGPMFVFGHFLVPHGPFVFDAAGRCLSQAEARERGPEQGYVDQIAYAGKIMRELVTALQADASRPPIIIIQSDEGPFPQRDPGLWLDAQEDEIEMKTSILNAYYFPEAEYGALYQDITPVNSFRIVFNTFFNTDLDIIPDRTYGFPHGGRLYEFFDVTEAARRP